MADYMSDLRLHVTQSSMQGRFTSLLGHCRYPGQINGKIFDIKLHFRLEIEGSAADLELRLDHSEVRKLKARRIPQAEDPDGLLVAISKHAAPTILDILLKELGAFCE